MRIIAVVLSIDDKTRQKEGYNRSTFQHSTSKLTLHKSLLLQLINIQLYSNATTHHLNVT